MNNIFFILLYISVMFILLFWWIFKEIVKNQNLYRKKDERWGGGDSGRGTEAKGDKKRSF